MDAQLLTQADFTLNRCGRPVAPDGLSVVYLYKAFLVQQYFAANPSARSQTVTKEVVGDATWCLRAIQIVGGDPSTATAPAVSFQVLLPNGKFLINNLQDVNQVGGYGSYRYLFGKELSCPIGSKLQVTFLDTNTAAAQPIAVLFEGAYQYFLRGGQAICSVQDAAAGMPRYLRNFNENIMAPCWMQGIGPAVPAGKADLEWVYGASGLVTNAAGAVLEGATAIDVANGPFAATQQISIDAASDFRCRRLLFRITADATVTAGTLLCRVRTGSGYALTDDYFDVATYIGSAPMAKDWDIPASDSVYVDIQYVNDSGGDPGTGSIYLQTYLEGTKRRDA